MNFDRVMFHILNYEGGGKLIHDSGGLTKWGISSHAYPHLDIANFSKDQAIDIYRHDYWLPINGDGLPAGIRLAAMDCAVNEGVGTARKFLHRTQDLGKFLVFRQAHYKELIQHNPNKYARYGKGWMNRIERVRHDSLTNDVA